MTTSTGDLTSNSSIAEPVLLFLGVLSNSTEAVDRARRLIEIVFHMSIVEYGPVNFDFTDFYNGEMGPELLRRVWLLNGLMDPEDLHLTKLLTGNLEAALAGGAGRPRIVNLDPGYMSLARIALFTTKDRPHRLYLGSGIYGESTLQFFDSSYRDVAHTYADYRSPELRGFFNEQRPALKSLLRDYREGTEQCRNIYQILGDGQCSGCGESVDPSAPEN
ncbi:MAG: hypothetical protein CVV64_04210 [Candidatus Wallbacteria bacterium HGW-Wallbacteria-1]|jgi:hypothetical protein|uniref:DUF4416 domain-containing protein n=1 Tax=Candidatus Wallbacteria bacterium HGW-Wallbacteria-1 TaxID=2013854 RepID=A0A2N1PRL3_9BACT|nr:MAG: hypothetical protein CVV64_04210 [Candidatus Wallbacteria bacterium HGW-Wallbacteria-1]